MPEEFNNQPDNQVNQNQQPQPLSAGNSGNKLNNDDPSAVKAPAKKESFMDKIDFSSIKAYVTIILSFAVVVASVIVFIIPQFKEFGEITAQKSEIESEYKKVKSRADYLQELYENKDELEGNIEIATQAIPLSEDEIPFVLDQMIQIARTNGVEINSLSLGGSAGEDKPGQITPIKMQMSVSGSYKDIMDYLHGIENARRLVSMNNLNVSGGGEDPQNSNYKITTSLTGYYMPESSLEDLTIEQIVSKSNWQDVLEKVQSLEYYEPQEIDIEIGRIDPFSEEEAEATEEDISSGFSESP